MERVPGHAEDRFLPRLKSRESSARYLELDEFSKRYGKGILSGAGTVSHQEALAKAEAEYKKYRQKTISDLSPVERDFLKSIKETQKQLKDGKMQKEDGNTEN